MGEDWLKEHGKELVVMPEVTPENFEIQGFMIKSKPCPRCNKVIGADLRPYVEEIREKGHKLFHNSHKNCITERKESPLTTIAFTVGESVYVVWTGASNYEELVKLTDNRPKFGGAPMKELSFILPKKFWWKKK